MKNNRLLAIRSASFCWSLVCIVPWLVVASAPASAFDQYWNSLLLQKEIQKGSHLDLELIARSEDSFSDPFFLKASRASYTRSISSDQTLQFQLGAAYFDVDPEIFEWRLHQHLFLFLDQIPLVAVQFRLGLEQRFFNQDSFLHLRSRLRVQGEIKTRGWLRPTFFNEIFVVPNGQSRFKTGFNENRLAAGIHARFEGLDFWLYAVNGQLRKLDRSLSLNWIFWQLQWHF